MDAPRRPSTATLRRLTATLTGLGLLLTAAVGLAQDPSFELSYEHGSRGRTLIKVVAPEDAECAVIPDEGRGERTLIVPFAYRAEPDLFYTLDCLLPSGATWVKKVEARPGRVARLVIHDAAPVVVVPVVVPDGVVVDEVIEVHEMAPEALSRLSAAVNNASFSDDKLAVLRQAAKHNWFTVYQVGVLMDLLAFSNDKLEAVRLLAPRVLDPENAHALHDHLTFSSDREALGAILEGALPRPY